MGHTDDDELDGHQNAEEEKDELEDRPSLCFQELEAPWAQHQGVPCSHRESAHEEVLVRG